MYLGKHTCKNIIFQELFNVSFLKMPVISFVSYSLEIDETDSDFEDFEIIVTGTMGDVMEGEDYTF